MGYGNGYKVRPYLRLPISGMSKVRYSRSGHWAWIGGARYLLGVNICEGGRKGKRIGQKGKSKKCKLKKPTPHTGQLWTGTCPSQLSCVRPLPLARTRILTTFWNINITLEQGYSEVTCVILFGVAFINCSVTEIFIHVPSWDGHVLGSLPCDQHTWTSHGKEPQRQRLASIIEDPSQQWISKPLYLGWEKVFASHRGILAFCKLLKSDIQTNTSIWKLATI